jgi:hypothetical protein
VRDNLPALCTPVDDGMKAECERGLTVSTAPTVTMPCSIWPVATYGLGRICAWKRCGLRAGSWAAALAGRLDWSAWIVDVHDAAGRRVLILMFEEAGPALRAA